MPGAQPHEGEVLAVFDLPGGDREVAGIATPRNGGPTTGSPGAG